MVDPHACRFVRTPGWLFAVCVGLVACCELKAQTFRAAGTEFEAVRPVVIPPDKAFTIAVVEFYHHGLIDRDKQNVLVVTRRNDPVPTRILQVGPGDFCRVAFQVEQNERLYNILYGGERPRAEMVPEWTCRDGLLLETRRWTQCNLYDFESVKKAFESAEPIGADYVREVRHAYNPFDPNGGPFLSRYSGYLHIGTAGKYGFFTSSQDCSFLVIDGRVVTSAPGRHRPERWARPQLRKVVQLTAGVHHFEYYHAAAGPEAVMVAAWEPNPKGDKPQPQAIPPEAFRAERVGHVPAGPPVTQTQRLMPDFWPQTLGEVPLPETTPLIAVRFENRSPTAALTNARVTWDFGDGQTSQEVHPVHIYLRPGVYTVKLSLKRGTRTLEMSNRIKVDRPILTPRDKLHTIDQYLPIISQYDPKQLDAQSLFNLVQAYLFKASLIQAEAPDQPDQGANSQELSREELRQLDQKRRELHEQVLQYLRLALEAGQTAFLEPESKARGDAELLALARVVAPLAREDFNDPKLAGKIWYAAAQKIVDGRMKAECAVAAADIALNDLLDKATARKLLEFAQEQLGAAEAGPLAARLARVLGDLYAMEGDGEKARQQYRLAEQRLGNTRTYIESIAWQGAYSRSTEEFLRIGQLGRAVKHLHQWQDEFPTAKIEGYWNLLMARYHAARQQYELVTALAEQLLAVNPDSPYIDQLLMLAADCELAQNRPEKAEAILSQLIQDYPGSPLVNEARQKLEQIRAGTLPQRR